jgi:hypothetical protein
LLIAAASIFFSCDLGGGGGGGGDDDDDSPDGSWYFYEQSKNGFALSRYTLTIDGDSFTEMGAYRNSAGEWVDFMGLRGTLAEVSGDTYEATLTSIYLFDLVEHSGTAAWHNAGSDVFDYVRPYVWSRTSNAARISLDRSGDTLSYRRDQEGDDGFDGAGDLSRTLSASSVTSLSGSGSYPDLQYNSLNFHGNPDRFYSSIEFGSMLGEVIGDTKVSSVSMIVTTPTGPTTAIPFEMIDDDGEWKAHTTTYPYTFANPAEGGIWWVSRIDIAYANGSSAVYTSASPHDDYAFTYETESGSTGSGTSEKLAAQDYMPPNAAGAGKTLVYIETEPNATSDPDDGFDTKIYLYAAGDLENWIAANDDGHEEGAQGDGLYSELTVDLAPGTYYLRVTDLNENAGFYSLRINASGLTNEVSTGTASGADDYEDDDTAAAAKTFTLGATENRSYAPQDADWVKFVVPAT